MAIKLRHVQVETSPVLLVILVMTIAICLLAFPHTSVISVTLLAILSVTVFFYNLIWQFGRIDEITGGMPRVSLLYSLAFLLLLAGYAFAAGSFILLEPDLALLGGFLIVGGIILAQFSNALLLQHIFTGRRWRLVQSSGHRG